MRIGVLLLAIGLLPTCALASCSPPPPRDVTVFAASSLREAFTDLGRTFQAAHPGAHVHLQFAGSHELRMQLQQGAQADLFVSADESSMAALGSLAPRPVVFACNQPVLVLGTAVHGVERFADLARVERVVLGAPEVPIGRYADEILAHADPGFAQAVRGHVVSREANVRQVLAKVTLGEAQAAIVYRTDALVAGPSVRVLEIPRDLQVLARYPLAVLTTGHSTNAQAFADLATSPAGWKVLSQHGFSRCPEAGR